MQVTIQTIKEVLSDSDTIFMKQGKGGKTVHVSDGKSRSNSLLCGVTYSRNGRRQSYLFPLNISQVDSESMCKNCLANLNFRLASLLKAGN